MATRTRATTTCNTPMKEKTRGTSPSKNTGPTPRKIAQKNNSPAKSHDPAATNSSGKPVPNYLKATLSSGLDNTKGDKAFSSVSTNDDASSKLATVNRRRSFDKPQPPYNSQSQQIGSRISPNPTSRSSSTGKISSASSQRTASNKGLVRGTTTKDGVVKQHHSLYAKSSMGSSNNAKKSTPAVYGKKQVIGTSNNGPSMMKKEEVVTISPIEKAEDDHNVSDDVTEAEVVEHEVLQESKAEDGNEKEDDLESEEVVANNHETEVIESDKDAKIFVTAESSTVAEQEHDRDDESVGVKSEEGAEETNQDDLKEEIIIKEVNDYNNDSDNHENEIAVAADNNMNEPIEDVEEEDEKEEYSKRESTETANASEASREEAKETETDDQVKEEVAVEKKPEAENNVTEKYQGKRESAVSNDVIEETACKLREQRKNKVKALAGAFETVISLQDSK